MLIANFYLGTVSRDGYFLMSKHFGKCADGFKGLSKAFHYPIHTIINFLFASLILTNFEPLKHSSEFCSLWLVDVLVPTSSHPWLQGKCARINLTQAVFGMILQNHRRFPVSIFSVKVAALGLWSLIFSSTKKQKIVKTNSACTESTSLLL